MSRWLSKVASLNRRPQPVHRVAADAVVSDAVDQAVKRVTDRHPGAVGISEVVAELVATHGCDAQLARRAVDQWRQAVGNHTAPPVTEEEARAIAAALRRERT